MKQKIPKEPDLPFNYDTRLHTDVFQAAQETFLRNIHASEEREFDKEQLREVLKDIKEEMTMDELLDMLDEQYVVWGNNEVGGKKV